MSYVGDPFRHDIFVSYSHGDVTGAGDSKLKRWSGAFARELESELRAMPGLGRELKIFLDQESIDPSSHAAAQLRAEIEASAVLCALMSPHYLGSEWCKFERDSWVEGQGRHAISCEGRIAVARIWPTTEADADLYKWPPAMLDARGDQLIGFFFHDRKNIEDKPQPFGWPDLNPDNALQMREFREILQTMVMSLTRTLTGLRKGQQERLRREAEASKLVADVGQIVYLHGRSGDATTWEQAHNRLADSGFIVMPESPETVETDPRRALEQRQNRVRTLSACDALLLVGHDGRALDADLVMIGRQDRQSARAMGENKLLPCAVLDDAGTIDASPRRKQIAAGLGIDVIAAAAEQWPPQVRTWLQRKGPHAGVGVAA